MAPAGQTGPRVTAPATRPAATVTGLPPRFWLLFAGRTVSVLGNAFGPIAIAFGVLALPGATPATLSAVLAAQTVPQLALLLFGGVVGDRFPRYRVLVAAELLSGLAYAGLAAMLLSGWAPLPALAACAFVSGTASALLLPSLSGAVAEAAGRDRLQQANGCLRLGANAARVAGLAGAGATVALLGPGVALALDAATYFLAAALLGLVRLPPAARTRSRSVIGDLGRGWREFTSRPWLWSTVAAAAFINVASTAGFGMLGPVVARERLGGPVAWSAVMTGYALGMMAGVAVALRLRPRRPVAAALLATPFLALPLLTLGLGAPLAVTAVAAFASGVALDVFGVLWETTVQREVPQESLSRVNSYEHLVAHSLQPVGVMAAGWAAHGLGPQPTLLVLGSMMIVAGLAVLALPAVRDLTADDEGAQP
ncbi:MFS transporter [Thermoactinospora rubra]|uniref:MFS transporter n=1 Tax=Thermoactinospora rubra TaxID=1088767 RepID=UPI001F0B36FA|nr:MFS transporter [Thermoactinospora rubra]